MMTHSDVEDDMRFGNSQTRDFSEAGSERQALNYVQEYIRAERIVETLYLLCTTTQQ